MRRSDRRIWQVWDRILESAEKPLGQDDVAFRLDRWARTVDPEGVHDDVEACLRAMRSKDARFDGWFFTAVLTTGIYCRPSCPVAPPKVENVRFYGSAAAAQQAGFRACKRCRPDASPGSPGWNTRADVVGRAMRLIADGVVDREGVHGLARRLGYSRRQVQRHLMAEVGAGPLALARAQRSQTVRTLIETSALSMSDVAFAAGFTSIRAFNETVRQVFALTPSELRRRATHGRNGAVPGELSLRLPYRTPLCQDSLFGQLAARAVDGVEEWRDGAYRRTLRLPRGPGLVTLRARPDHIACRLVLGDLRDLPTAINRCRHLLDLDADPVAIDDQLRSDPVLASLVDQHPGRRVLRAVDPAERAIRAVLGERRSSTTTSRVAIRRLVAAHGDGVADYGGGLTHLFPDPAVLAARDPAALAVPPARRAPLAALVAALAEGELDLGIGSSWSETRRLLGSLPGLGPSTVETVMMGGLGDPDAFVPTDGRLRRSARQLGLDPDPRAIATRSSHWRPWRAYAFQHLCGPYDGTVVRRVRKTVG